MAITAVVFDCDGVLFDSRGANVEYYNHILAHFGREPMGPQDEDYVHAHTGPQSVAHLFRDDPRQPEAMAFEKGVDYGPFIPLMRPEPGIQQFLAWLGPRFRTAVWTNRTRTIGAVLEAHELTAYFDLVVSAADAEPKPDPAGMELILSRFSLGPESVIYVGDTWVDQKAAENAGVFLAAYKSPELKCGLHLADFDRLRRWLDSSRV